MGGSRVAPGSGPHVGLGEPYPPTRARASGERRDPTEIGSEPGT